MLSLAILYPMGGTAIKDVTNTITASATSESSTPTDESSFTFDSSTGTITKYTGTDASVVIPDTIGGVKVTAIGEEAFYECETLKDITISDNVTYIGVSAFYSCTALENITLSQNLTSIDEGAFSKCSALTSINIPDSVTYIGKYGISNCTKLKDITLSKNLTSISEYTFSGCQSLESITIPDSVTSLDDGVFWYCEKLKDVTLSKNLTSIGEDVFSGAVFTEIEIPSSVTTIKEEAFYHCEKLASITIPKNVTSIDDKAFVGCNSLKTVYICSKSIDTSNLKIFGDYTEPHSVFTFDEDTGTITKYTGTATEVAIPNAINGVKVTAIGKDAFNGNTSLRIVEIPSRITSIETDAFSNCNSLTNIIIYKSKDECTNFSLPEESGTLTITYAESPFTFDKTTGTITGYTGIAAEVEIPNTIGGVKVTTIGQDAFSNTGLTSITIPKNVTSIGNYAFLGCNSLKTIYLCNSNIDASKLNISYDGTLPQSIFTFDEDTGTITKYTGTATKVTIPDTMTLLNLLSTLQLTY